ncbi:MAG TPA: sialidase family protein [Ktedonobacterales bacterium]|nr:sialidase family protein [Ktedonobacterales bacterium]
MAKRWLLAPVVGAVILTGLASFSLIAHPAVASAGSGVGNLPQGTQTDSAFAGSFKANKVTNVMATTQQTSCYTPEAPYFTSLAPANGYSGMSACNGAATTGENLGPYDTQTGSNAGFPAATPMLVKDHSESDIRVDPTNPLHVIGSSKWFVSAEGYNHLLGFYESFDGGKTFTIQGHIPGYEGWTDNTDPVGAFDSYGNYYEFVLAYQFYYNADGSHNFQINQNKTPNPNVAAEAVSIVVHPRAASPAAQTAANWNITHNGAPDSVATYPAKGREPDKQWIAIDTNPASPHFNRIYAMWTLFDSFSAVPYIAYADARPDGTHTDWSAPEVLPTPGFNPQGDTYLLPHVDPSGAVYTTITNFAPKQGFCCGQIILDASTDGGVTWSNIGTVARNIAVPGATYNNTTFRTGIENTFAVGNHRSAQGHYPLYVSWEDFSAGVDNVILSASADGGATWSAPIQVNDNAAPTDEFQPNLTVAANGTVSVAFYDRRLGCPARGTAEATGAGLALDTANANWSGALPPYDAANYCVNAAVQFYTPALAPDGHNIRLTAHTWDPQLNAPHSNSASSSRSFIGDYFGNATAAALDYTTFVSTFDDGTNLAHQQQQVVATVAVP